MKINLIILLPILLTFTSFSLAQTTLNESFGGAGPYPAQNLPLGWSGGATGITFDPDNHFDRVNVGSSPSALPISPPAMLRYAASSIVQGHTAFVCSTPYDMSTISGGATFGLWMYRDSGLAIAADRIEILVNNAPNLTGAVLLTELNSGSDFISRNCSLLPLADSCNAWNQYLYSIPGNFNTFNTYVIIKAYSENGNNIYIDNFSIDTYPSPQTYSVGSTGVVVQFTDTVPPATQDQPIIGGKFTINGGGAPLILFSNFIFNTNGSTSPNPDITTATLWTTYGSPVFDPLIALPLGSIANPWGTNFSFPGPWSLFQNGENYIWLTMDINPTAIVCDNIDAEWLSFTPGANPVTPVPHTLQGHVVIAPCSTTSIQDVDQLQFEFKSIHTTTDMIFAEFTSVQPSKFRYTISDVTGRAIAASQNNFATIGSNTIEIKTTLQQGIYFLTLENNQYKLTEKFFVGE